MPAIAKTEVKLTSNSWRLELRKRDFDPGLNLKFD